LLQAPDDDSVVTAVRTDVKRLAEEFPLYPAGARV